MTTGGGGGGGGGTNNGDDSNPPSPPDDSCCELIQIILEKVERIETEINEFKGGNDWVNYWDFELEPLFSEEEFSAKQGPGSGIRGLYHIIRDLFRFNLDIYKDLAAKENYVAMPERWQLPPESQRPQLVVQSAELDENGNLGSAKYVTSIPYYKEPEEFEIPPFTSLAHGSTQGMLILKDNSKVIIYAQNQTGCDTSVKSN